MVFLLLVYLSFFVLYKYIVVYCYHCMMKIKIFVMFVLDYNLWCQLTTDLLNSTRKDCRQTFCFCCVADRRLSPHKWLSAVNSIRHKPKFHMSRHVTSCLDTTGYLAHAFWHWEKLLRGVTRRAETCHTCRTARRDTLVTTSATGATRTTRV